MANDSGSTSQHERLWTIPNVLSLVRLGGAAALVGLAWTGARQAVAVLYAGLAATDWLDGKLAILLRQRTTLGARLDSAADAVMYGALLAAALRLCGEALRGELGWLAAALASYAASVGAALWKYGRPPSYHTRAAKTSWLLIAIGTFSLLGGWSLWPLRAALAAVTLTNIEAVLMTWVLPAWTADVPSLVHAVRLRRAGVSQGR